jgi:hypothetical protein
MSKLGINTGSVPNDGTGDTLLSGAVKINTNFNEIYSSIGDGSNLVVGVGKTVLSILLSGNVGVGSTIPASKLDVSGNINGSSISIGNTQIVSGSFQLKNIASLDSTTISTIENAITLAPNTFTDLNITGISTFINGPVLIGGGSSTGNAATVLQISGINSSVYVGGNIGIGTINPSRRVQVAGDASTNQFNASISITNTNSAGYGAYYGLNATSISSGRDWRLVSNGLSDSAGVGKFSILDVSAGRDRLVIDSSGNIGISSLSPSSKLTVSGDVFITGVVTATSFIGLTTVATSVIGGIASVTQLNVTGIGTISNLSGTTFNYSSGFINAGVVTNISGTTLNYPSGFINAGVVTTITGVNLNYSGLSTFTGPVVIGGGNSTGITSSVLQLVGINSNAYIGGNLGIGISYTTLPLQVVGIVSATTVRDGIGTIRTIPQNAQSSGGIYTATSSDVGKHISISSGIGVSINAGTFSIGDVFYVFNNTTGTITIGAGAGVSIFLSGNYNPGTGIRTMMSRALATVLCVNNNTFVAGALAGAATTANAPIA